MKSKSTNIEWLDTLRALAIIGVILIHVSTPTVKMMYGKNMFFWWIGNIMDSSVRFSVPVFLMLSGATMLGKEYKLIEFYKKRITRVLFPFLLWIIIYWIYNCLILPTQLQPETINSILHWAIRLFLNDGVSKHFWYIYMILFLYPFVPFLGKGLRKLNKSSILFILLGWLMLTFACRSIPLNLYNWSNSYLSKFLGYLLYAGYLVLGYFINEFSSTPTRIRYSALMIFLLTIFISAYSTYIFSIEIHKLDLRIYSYLSLNTILQSIALFICIKNSSIQNKCFYAILNSTSNYSYGIYLVHIIVIGIFFQYGIFWTMAHPLFSIPLITLLTLLTSMVIIYVLRKIPSGKYISG